ncbi:unnamed protein product [Echinostoma caproni]|uniref:Transposase n=1 Tax=Echinostoma caproni TaxID=27848 RepID=A0A183B998_9TREM|nr:unnamed protein product [Echinostoma caproni]
MSGTRDYEALDVFVNDLDRAVNNPAGNTRTKSSLNEVETGKRTGLSKISFSPSYNDALNLCSTNRADAWITRDPGSQTKSGSGA